MKCRDDIKDGEESVKLKMKMSYFRNHVFGLKLDFAEITCIYELVSFMTAIDPKLPDKFTGYIS